MDRQLSPGESPKRNVRIFISHAYEDIQGARRLYEDLKNAGLDPWLETESLLPGQNWESAVHEAIRKSTYFIPLFSSMSVGKRGFVLKEFKYALGILDSIPEPNIFIIPVRLDNCEIPYEKLKSYQYVDLFPSWNDGLQKILELTGIKTKELKLETSLSTPSFLSNEWDALLTSIYEKRCIPFIGAEGHTPWIPPDRDIARIWAQEYRYPLEADELPKVSLYLAIINDDESYPKMLLSKYISGIQPPDITLKEFRNTLYGVLANLNLPIYITTNYDHFMEEALKSTGKSPVSEFCRWNEKLKDYTKAAGVSSVFDKGRMYNPTASEPLVYHLYGDLEVPQSMVLTEKDYFDFLMNIYREDEKLILPSVIRKALATSLLLFTGYKIDDLSFRIMRGSLAPYTNLPSRYQNIVILPPPLMPPNSELENIHKYLDRYAKTLFNVHIYWGDNSSFSRELHKRWQNFMINLSP